jgi:hypothetical protein
MARREERGLSIPVAQIRAPPVHQGEGRRALAFDLVVEHADVGDLQLGHLGFPPGARHQFILRLGSVGAVIEVSEPSLPPHSEAARG